MIALCSEIGFMRNPKVTKLPSAYEEFRPRTIWSLSKAFTSAFKELDPVPQFKATAKLGEFLETRFSQSV
jgi:hypothetical protein